MVLAQNRNEESFTVLLVIYFLSRLLYGTYRNYGVLDNTTIRHPLVASERGRSPG
jgi:hypothetical protein